ncbi:MAG: hypothetical protein KDC54_08735 [Lewinella sp.]|nr:hypothetical protein [Lewinella sp.]
MRLTPSLLILLFLCTLAGAGLSAQRVDRARERLQEYRADNWPPERVYSRVSLGRALQNVFERHFEYCGFSAGEGSRDYLPADISKFLGSRDLRTKVETADLAGASLLAYIFRTDQKDMPLNVVRFQPEQVLDMPGLPNQFILDPDLSFDAFLLTKNCSGYLKAALDAGIEPPYAAFRSALGVDDRRESTVVAVSGAFVSPVHLILRARDARTTQLMLQLWQYYQAHPEFIGQAYYLKGFEGVMVKHVASAEETSRIENSLGININGPLGSRLDAGLTIGRTGQEAFSGTDWETIVYADFDEHYSRADWYAPLPTPAEISAYFAQLHPVFQRPVDFPLLTEGAEHRHYLIMEGIPASLARAPWVIEAVGPGVYAQTPRLETTPFSEGEQFGCRFTVAGQPAPALFTGPRTDRPGKVDLHYRIRCMEPVGGYHLFFEVGEELATSAHPVVNVHDGRFDLSLKEDRRFAFQWKVTLEVEDAENPVNFTELPYISNVLVRRGDQQSVDVRVADVALDARRKQYVVTLETVATWPLQRIDDQQMVNYNLSMEVHLPSQRSTIRPVRPVKGNLSFPTLRPEPPATPVPPVMPMGATQEPGSGEGEGE